MDTGSHILMGVGLTALATLDVDIARNTSNIEFIAACTIAGSLIPDIDVALKAFGNDIYIKNHRGISHSLPFIFLWSLIIPIVITIFNNSIDYWVLWRWTLLAVTGHVITDIFNGYGTQALWPFHKKWIALGVTYTFDVVTIVIHLIGFLILLFTDAHPGYVFLTIYILMAIYLMVQLFHKHQLKKILVKEYGPLRRYVFVSKTLPHTWKYVVECQSKYFYIGLITGAKLTEQDKIKKETRIPEEYWDLIQHDFNMRSFLYFSPIYNWKISEDKNGIIEIRAFDLRYLSENRKGEMIYAFTALCHIKDGKITDSYMGFIFDEDLLQKHLKKKVHYRDYIHILKNAD
jgi:inner membrane protein